MMIVIEEKVDRCFINFYCFKKHIHRAISVNIFGYTNLSEAYHTSF